MKQNTLQITKAVLFCLIIALSSCEKNEPVGESATAQIASIPMAKTWFEEFKSKEKFNLLFQNLVYHWDKASVSILTDGSKAIIVPITEPNQSVTYNGKKILYLYPLKTKQGFDQTLFELLPYNKSIEKKQDVMDLNTFDGYIVNWDLVKGFEKGSKFINNKSVCNITLKVVITDKIQDGNPVIPITQLDDVTIQAGCGGGGYSYSIGSGTGFSGGTSSGGYLSGPHTSAGGGNSGSNTSTSSTSTHNPCDNLKVQVADPNYKAKIAELKTKTGEKNEYGYSQNDNGSFDLLHNGTSGGSMSFNIQPNMIGYMHTHPDARENGEYDIDGNPKIESPIHMFSPPDVKSFLLLLLNAQANNIPLESIYGNMISSNGTYALQFTGNIDDVRTDFDWDGTAFTAAYKLAIYNGGEELGFLKFLRDNIGINGIELYKIKDNGKTQNKTLNSNNKLQTIDCL